MSEEYGATTAAGHSLRNQQELTNIGVQGLNIPGGEFTENFCVYKHQRMLRMTT